MSAMSVIKDDEPKAGESRTHGRLGVDRVDRVQHREDQDFRVSHSLREFREIFLNLTRREKNFSNNLTNES